MHTPVYESTNNRPYPKSEEFAPDYLDGFVVSSFYKSRAIAKLLAVTVPTVQAMMRDGRLPVTRMTCFASSYSRVVGHTSLMQWLRANPDLSYALEKMERAVELDSARRLAEGQVRP